MPITPLHLAAGLPVRRHISMGAFIVINCVIDLEVVMNVMGGMDSLGYPLHQGMHTLVGATFVAMLITPFKPDSVKWRPWIYGLLYGAWSHVLLDSLCHDDVEVFSPWIDGNPFCLNAHGFVTLACAAVLTYYLAKWVESLRIGEVVARWFKDQRR